MEVGTIFIIIGIVFSVFCIGLAVFQVMKAIYSEDMKYSHRKDLLKKAGFNVMEAVTYWLMLGFAWAMCMLKAWLDTFI